MRLSTVHLIHQIKEKSTGRKVKVFLSSPEFFDGIKVETNSI
jgi:hypothetical protein